MMLVLEFETILANISPAKSTDIDVLHIDDSSLGERMIAGTQ